MEYLKEEFFIWLPLWTVFWFILGGFVFSAIGEIRKHNRRIRDAMRNKFIPLNRR